MRYCRSNQWSQFRINLGIYWCFLKQKYLDENMVILEPITDLTYEELVKIMDAVRLLNKTDPEIYKKDKDGIDTKVNDLFNKIVFGNLMS